MIEGWVGRPGSGKSYNLTKRILDFHVPRGDTIFSNMSLSWKQKGSMRHAEVFDEWEQVLDMSNCVVVIDEIGQWLAAREWASRKNETMRDVLRRFSQHRKHGMTMYWTAQSREQLDSYVLRMTMTVYECERWGPIMGLTPMEPVSGKKWARSLCLLQKRVFDAYDTYEVVAGVDTEGKRRQGDAAYRRMEDWVKKELDGAYVSEDGVWRPAGVMDLGKRVLLQRRGGAILKLRPEDIPEWVDLSWVVQTTVGVSLAI